MDSRLRDLERVYAETRDERDLRRFVAERERIEGSYPILPRAQAREYGWVFAPLTDLYFTPTGRWRFYLCRFVGAADDVPHYVTVLTPASRGLSSAFDEAYRAMLGAGDSFIQVENADVTPVRWIDPEAVLRPWIDPAEEARAVDLGEVGRVAREHWNRLVTQVLERNPDDYDGAPFFSQGHGGVPQSNDMTPPGDIARLFLYYLPSGDEPAPDPFPDL